MEITLQILQQVGSAVPLQEALGQAGWLMGLLAISVQTLRAA